MKKSRYLVFILSIVLVAIWLTSPQGEDLQKKNPQTILNKTNSLQIPFIENKGQIENESLKYYAQTFAGTVFVTKNGQIIYSLPLIEESMSRTKKTELKGWVIKESLVGAAPIESTGREKAITKVNSFKGNDQSLWKTDIPTYNSVSFGEVYEGIELKLQAHGNNIEKIFTVNPGANLSDIQLKIEGTHHLDINEKGELDMKTGLGTVSFTEPVAYQEEGETKIPVELAYVLHGTDTYGFEAGHYDRTKPLIIDPLLASTFIGAGNGERANAIAVQGAYVVVAGWARSGFPTTPGAYDQTYNGGDYDTFISIFDSDLTTLYASTFFGGSGQDACHAVAIDSSTNIYIAGYTDSTDLPTTTGAYDESHNGSQDVFVSKLNFDINSLLASTFIGGTYADYCHSVNLDTSGNVFVTGYTYSQNFPTTPGAYDETDNPGVEAFVSKFTSDLATLSASTHLGGSDSDFGDTVRIYGTDTVYVYGNTRSSNFPTTVGAYDESHNGNDDVFVAIFNASLSTLSASTFIGGSNYDRPDLGHSLAIDGSGNVYIVGETNSSNYPTTAGAYDETYNGGSYDTYVSKLNSSLTTLSASTFLGGDGFDSGTSIILDGSANIYVSGSTQSSNFPTTSGAYDESHNGGWDNYLSKLNNSLSVLSAGTFLGGSIDDGWAFCDLDGTGNVFIAGYTYSSDFPTTPGAYDESFNGQFDVFVSKLDGDLSAPAPMPDIKANGSDGPITINRGDTISITIALDSGDHTGEDADWWLLCKTSLPAPNDWFYYNLSIQTWMRGQLVSRQGPLVDFGPIALWNRTGFPACTLNFFFGVDMNMNGSINPSVLYYDRVQVTINP